MNQYTMYICEYCGKESRSGKEILTCEGSHIGRGLTYKEYETYRNLKGLCEMTGCEAMIAKNEKTEKIFNDAINKLTIFEKEHGINNTFNKEKKTMVITKRICDRCKTEITENKNNLKNHYTVSHYGDSVVVPDKNYDLCDDCEKKLIEWLNLSEIEEVNQEEE